MGVSRAPERGLSRREREIMDVIYRRGQATAAEVLEALPDPPSYSAVRAMLRVLEEKGHLRHEQQGPRYVFLPMVPRAGTAIGPQAARAHFLRRIDRTGRRHALGPIDTQAFGRRARPACSDNRPGPRGGTLIMNAMFLDLLARSPRAILALDVTVKATLVLAVAGVVALALHRASAAARHLVWCLGLSAALAVPVFYVVLPGWNWRILPMAGEGAHPARISRADTAAARLAPSLPTIESAR